MNGEPEERNWWDAPLRRSQSVEITPEILQTWCGQMRTLVPADSTALQARALRAYVLAQQVLAAFLGWDWIRERVHRSSDSTNFLRASPPNDGGLDSQRHMIRVITLGEFLFNFQKVPGVIERILDLTDRVEPPFAELHAAMLLYRARIPFRFVPAKKERGADYDIELLLPSGRKACGETKCKVEETDLTVQSVRNSLETARRQLPKNEPGVIFLSLPERAQTLGLDFNREVDASIKDFLRQSGRIGIVVVFTSAVVQLPNGNAVNAIMTKEIPNPASRFADEFSSGTLIEGWTESTVRWTQLMEVCPAD